MVSNMERIILGDGMSGMIIAACLDYLGYDFIIYGKGEYKSPPIMLLECDAVSKNRYASIFEIDDIDSYIHHITIGYLFKDKIYDTPDETILYNYYLKQSRVKSGASMSNSKNEFDAIALNKVYDKLYEKYKDKIITDYIPIYEIEHDYRHTIVYNTIFDTNSNNYKPSFEYIEKTPYNNLGYSYIYDCNIKSNVKRITPVSKEYLSNDKLNHNLIEIKNYYNEPAIYKTYNPKKDFTWIDISRNATHTQLKQEDIIKYILENE